MVKVTLNKNLVPFTGTLPVRSGIYTSHDLTHNYLFACKVIRAARILFQMRKDVSTFSGYVLDQADSAFRINVRHKGASVRTVLLSNLGFGGLLVVEVSTRKLEDAIGLDVLGSLIEGNPEKKVIEVAADV